MKTTGITTLTLFASAFFAIAASADENRLYKSWAKYNVGTSVTTKMVNDAMGQKSEMETTTSLVEKTADKVVLETKMSMTVAGNKMDLPSQKTEVLATAPEVSDLPTDAAAPKPDIKESKGSHKIGDKEYVAKVVESKTKVGEMKAYTKSWMSDEVPGMMLKSETKTEGEFESSSTLEVIKVTIK